MHMMNIFLLLISMLISGWEQEANFSLQTQTELKHAAPEAQLSTPVNTESIPILMYHSISINPSNTLSVHPEVFYKQMEHLKNAGYNTITFKELMNWKTNQELPNKPILITFDDGYLDNFTVAYPYLKKLQMKATIFATSDYIGVSNHFDWNQAMEMEESGLIEMGVHTRHHVDLTKCSPLQLEDEISGAKKIMENRLGHPIISFAYPAGEFNPNVIEVVKRAGFEFAVTTEPGYAEKNQGYLTLHRVRIPGDQSIAAFTRKFP
ncbi:polysaccharide deacetylase family protein [Paenibacillus dakarensis]|uniref:polysaccharide deacetylase family protein n=1 Tax=Paenibacillus dakarensis TaxID=1527293 RepID=UPI0006D59AE7|nr:polysaccharide deacetylase family protein [Paenibacillus dakarensis]